MPTLDHDLPWSNLPTGACMEIPDWPWLTKPMVPYGNSPPILEPILERTGMFAGGTGF